MQYITSVCLLTMFSTPAITATIPATSCLTAEEIKEIEEIAQSPNNQDQGNLPSTAVEDLEIINKLLCQKNDPLA